MNCQNHSETEANKLCVGCGNLFCEDCITPVHGKNYCKMCMAELIEKKQEPKSQETKQPNIIIQQQQQQTVANKDGFVDQVCKVCCVIIGLIVLLWVAGIVIVMLNAGAV